MATTTGTIAGTFLGDNRSVDRTVPSIPQTDPIATAEMGVKKTQSSTAVLTSKSITTSNVAGVGQVVNTGASTGTGEVRFDWTPTDLTSTTFTAGWTHWYYIKVTTVSGQTETVETGTWPILQGGKSA